MFATRLVHFECGMWSTLRRLTDFVCVLCVQQPKHGLFFKITKMTQFSKAESSNPLTFGGPRESHRKKKRKRETISSSLNKKPRSPQKKLMVIKYFAENWFTIAGQLIIPLHFTNNILDWRETGGDFSHLAQISLLLVRRTKHWEVAFTDKNRQKHKVRVTGEATIVCSLLLFTNYIL